MTIEIAPPIAPVKTAPAKTAPAKETTGTKEKSTATDKATPADPAGFMAILASLGSDSTVEPAAESLAVPVAVDATLTGGPPQDATALLAQALQWMAPPGAPSADTRGADGDARSLLGATAPVPLVSPGAIGPKLDAAPYGPGALNFDTGVDAAQQANAVGVQRKGGNDQLDTAALQSLPLMGTALQELNDGRTEARDAKFVQADLAAKMAPSILESVAPMSINTPKREERSSAHGVFQSNIGHDVSGVAHAGGGQGSAVGSPSLATSDVAVVPQSYVAEKVAYWISNDVQRAEMKLDGLGENPVEVSISMNGNQAHVAFRTDEVQARDALENASLQLKEMLQKDGVVLSGMSVGTSSGGEAGAGSQQGRNARQGGKSATVMVEQPGRVDRASNAKTTVGRALDLFV